MTGKTEAFINGYTIADEDVPKAERFADYIVNEIGVTGLNSNVTIKVNRDTPAGPEVLYITLTTSRIVMPHGATATA